MSKTIIIDGIEYVAAVGTTPSLRQIVVIEGRWVIVGDVHDADDGVTITNGSVIRYWGTTWGLGELAKNGATSKTKLDPIGVTHVPAGQIIMRVNVESDL